MVLVLLLLHISWFVPDLTCFYYVRTACVSKSSTLDCGKFACMFSTSECSIGHVLFNSSWHYVYCIFCVALILLNSFYVNYFAPKLTFSMFSLSLCVIATLPSSRVEVTSIVFSVTWVASLFTLYIYDVHSFKETLHRINFFKSS